MGGKRSNQKKGGGGHKNNNTPAYEPKLSEDDLTNLTIEASQGHTLLNDRQKKLKEEKDFVYILSLKWLREWKDYVGYDAMFSDEKESKNNKMGRKKPGSINSELTVSYSGDFEVPEELAQDYGYLNTFISDKKDINDDYFAVTKEIWDFFNQIYGPGTEIKRPCKLTKEKLYVDGPLKKNDFIFVNYDESFYEKVKTCKLAKPQIAELIPNYSLQYTDLWSLEDLYGYISKIGLVLYNTEKVTLWLCENFMGTNSISEEFVKSAKLKVYTIFGQKLLPTDHSDLYLDDFIKENYTILIEFNESHITPEGIPDDLVGYCEECVKSKKLTVHCDCGHKHYCSTECQVDDQVFHYKSCELAFESVDDKEYEKKKIVEVGNKSLCGLKNLGNTCYMNSSVQALLNLDSIVNFLTDNKYKQEISKKEDDAGLFLDKISKSLKQMGEKTHFETIEPWEFKSQINFFMPPFQGYKQHDALDFFIGLLNTINDCLEKKNESEAYHKIIHESIQGEFDSLIICPVCDNKVQNQEIFTQLTLPIKSKVQRVTYTYTILHNPFTILSGNAEVKGTWSELRSDVGVSDKCLILSGKENESGLLEIDENLSVEAFTKKNKKEILFFPNEEALSVSNFISANLITLKTISGCEMKANSGYSFPIFLENSKTMGHLFIDIIRKVDYEKKENILEEMEIKFKEIKERETSLLLKLESSTEETQATEKSEENEGNENEHEKFKNEKDLIKNELLELNNQIIMVLSELKINLYVKDTDRFKNVCFFCKKKCETCLLSPDFTIPIEDSIGQKVKECYLLVHITPKPEQTKEIKHLTTSGEATLQDCLKLFGEPEILDEENAWYCSKCEDMRLAYKQLHVSKYPKYLIIQLSRFKQGANGKVKNNEPIQYNEYETFGERKYELASVIVHEGSIEGGHYWAICRRKDEFYIFNDEKVSKTDKICNKNAYILCYKQTQ